MTPLCGCAPPRGHPGAQARGAAHEVRPCMAAWACCLTSLRSGSCAPCTRRPRACRFSIRQQWSGAPERAAPARAQDVLTLRDLYEVNLGLARPDSPISFYDVEKGIVSAAPVRPPSIVHNCDIEHSLVGEGSLLNVRRARAPLPARRRALRACAWSGSAGAAAQRLLRHGLHVMKRDPPLEHDGQSGL